MTERIPRRATKDITGGPFPIRAATQACRQRLQECASQASLQNGHWAENRSSDFNLWDSGIGASANELNSLDRRLDRDISAQKVVVGALSTLAAWATKCRELAEEVERQPAGPLDHQNGSKSLSPDEQSIEIRDGITLDEAKNTVEKLLEILVNLEIVIRRAGTASRVRRADRTFHKRKHHYTELSTHLEFILRVSEAPRREHALMTQSPAPVEADEIDVTSTVEQLEGEKAPLRPEQQILLLANIKRTDRFLFYKGRQEQLRSEQVQKPSYPQAERVQVRSSSSPARPSNPPTRSEKQLENSLETFTDEQAMPDRSQHSTGTTNQASDYVATKSLEKDMRLTSPGVAATKIAIRADYPKPPKDKTKCPYCLIPLRGEADDLSQWRKHLSEDLQPYTCYVPNCPQNHPFFNTFGAWKMHVLSKDHQQPVGWTCLFCPFSSNPGEDRTFLDHVQSSHSDAVTKESLTGFVHMCRRNATPTLDRCPVCSICDKDWQLQKDRDVQFEPQTKSFLEHLGQCIHGFALRSLPETEPGKPEDESGQNQTDVSAIEDRSWPSGYLHVSHHTDAGLADSDLLEMVPALRRHDLVDNSTRTQAWVVDNANRIQSSNTSDPYSADVPSLSNQDNYAETKNLHRDALQFPEALPDESHSLRLNGPFLPHDYRLACICSTELELAPIRALLDEIHLKLPRPRDRNSYILGRIGRHSVVIALLPETENNDAAVAMMQLIKDFPSVRFGLSVGIDAGVPNLPNVDVRLGDVVVSMPSKTPGSVIHYDLGTKTKDSKVPVYLLQMLKKYPKLKDKYIHPGAESDQLFESSYDHHGGEDCLDCDSSRAVKRSARPSTDPVVHYGTIASVNRVLKNAVERDMLEMTNPSIVCVETEVAGLMDSFPCLAIRGICDYADSHKNKRWMPYAAATAAAYMKELLYMLSPREVSSTSPALEGTEVSQILAELEVIVREAVEDLSPSRQCRIVISGIDGQGKSEICLQLARCTRQLFWGVFWVDVRTTALAENGFLSIASRLDITVKTWRDTPRGLAGLNEPWLLVMANADDPDVDYEQYFPSGPLGVVLLTSRFPENPRYATSKFINLESLLMTEAQELLLRAARIPSDRHQLFQAEANLVASLLESHPLALIQAGACVSQGYCALKDYPIVYQEHRLTTARLSRSGFPYEHVYTTFEVSAGVLQSMNTESASDALELLSVLGRLASTPLPLLLLEAGWKGAQTILSDDRDDDDEQDLNRLSPWHVSHLPALISPDSPNWDSFRLTEALNLLRAFSHITTDTYDSGRINVSMHPLIHVCVQLWLDRGRKYASRIRAGCLVAISLQDTRLWSQHQWQLQPHMHALVSRSPRTKFLSGPSLMIVRILLKCANEMIRTGDDKRVFNFMELLMTGLGFDRRCVDRQWLKIYEVYGQSLLNLGEVKEAVPLLEELVMTREQTLPEDHPDRLTAQHDLERAYHANRQVREAVSLLEQVVEIQEQTLPEDHPDRLMAQHDLARAYHANRQVREAVSLSEQVVEIEEKTLTEDNPHRLAAQHNLARAYHANGQDKKAVPLLEQVVMLQRRTLAEDHPDRVASELLLSIFYWDLGDRQAAIHTARRVVEVRRRTLDANHPDRKNGEAWLDYFESETAQGSWTHNEA
ncbi:uncharacterized protein PV07_12307 [Cladophialophora immunda]|uniref:Uncharacterized protein n=1 Tax=Cladophialophora immunda TaxID=569365 RepID=A0A0D2BVH2_9EURO|nr:uncharacterized protein PV07_12307 [Cladophialophora immunda]KIW22420.1 hypothetical protein PV07_12307 [Cladophialophora immunda]